MVIPSVRTGTGLRDSWPEFECSTNTGNVEVDGVSRTVLLCRGDLTLGRIRGSWSNAVCINITTAKAITTLYGRGTPSRRSIMSKNWKARENSVPVSSEMTNHDFVFIRLLPYTDSRIRRKRPMLFLQAAVPAATLHQCLRRLRW